jgi:inositol phosphorylceramide mannosyltransferase catalytic subunit
MRRSLVIFLLALLGIVLFALHQVSTLLSLLIEDASVDAIHRSELPAPNSTLLESRPQVIPKIIHQTYINESIPAHWLPAQQSCIDLHPDYEYILWTDAMALDFISKEYPWFLNTFVGYKHNIQRADAIRYFVLAHYGGIYIDLDDGCQRRLDPLLSYNAWVRRTIPTGISNDLMGAIPQHPFFCRVIESLAGADRKWVLPYITIMGSTGPLFLSVMWKNWMNEHAGMSEANPSWTGRVRVLMPDENKGHPWSFFVAYPGSSWHGKDARFIFWMGRNWLFLVVAGFMIAGLVFGVGWVLYSRLVLWGKRRAIMSTKPNRARGGGGTFARMPLWRMWRNEGKGSYELVEQHDA